MLKNKTKTRRDLQQCCGSHLRKAHGFIVLRGERLEDSLDIGSKSGVFASPVTVQHPLEHLAWAIRQEKKNLKKKI